MKKVGIITLYYNNKNYGGLLQSYALRQYFENIGYDAYQISYRREKIGNNSRLQRLRNMVEETGLFGVCKKFCYKIRNKILIKTFPRSKLKAVNDGIKTRNKELDIFEKSIKHTKLYNKSNIAKSNDIFDIFVCGSDQIWKPGVNCDEYFLDFVNESKIKFSYAASIGRNSLAKSDFDYIKKEVVKLDDISLREQEAVDLFKQNNINCKLVLDPTLLLTRHDWEKFAKEYLINEKYIFCYFLGISKKQREYVYKFAKRKNLIIVNLPFLSNVPNKIDEKFGNKQLFDVSPENFVYLIKNAEYIFTDSFHAAVFSGIFNKEFFVFEREEEQTMNGRIINLLEIFSAKDRFISVKSNIENLTKYNDIYSNKKFKELREKSIDYINKNIR